MDESLHQPSRRDEEQEGGGGIGNKARMLGQPETESILKSKPDTKMGFSFSFQQAEGLFFSTSFGISSSSNSSSGGGGVACW